MKIAGVILAGGQARRMGGIDKALCQLAGRPLLTYVAEKLRAQVEPIALNANGDPAHYAEFGLPVLADTVPGFVGPLAGVLAGMRWAAKEDATHLVSVAVDTPFFPGNLVKRLLAAAQEQNTPFACAATTDPVRGLSEHPTFGLWPVDMADTLEDSLTVGEMRKIIVWTSRYGCARAMFDDAGKWPFFNINTPEDLRTASGIAGERA